MTWKIVADSGSDLKTLDHLAAGTQFVSVPLTIQIGSSVFVDDEGLDIDEMMATMYASDVAAGSACPSPEAYAKAFEHADNVIVFTITGGLSGSYNSARLAREMFLESHPNVNIHVVDSLSAGGEIDLLIQKTNELIAQGLDYEAVVEGITAYQQKTKLLFVLAKVDNLVKNGRLSKLVGKVVGLLNIRMVGEASPEGKLELLQKPRGQKKAVAAVIDEMLKAGYQGGKTLIAHCHNEKICQQLQEAICEKFPKADVQYVKTSGLCSFYAEDGGILLGYETL